tara:strand:+ start:455 stop:778 length:324 start_codon:yes stop_codon:yes gene_type:complete
MALTNPNRNIWDVTSASSGLELIPLKKAKGNLKSISITNQHSSTATTVSLYLDDGDGDADSDIFLAGPISIPGGVTLELDNVSFDNDIYALKITTLSGGYPLSIIAR